jgi:hypothetical protein
LSVYTAPMRITLRQLDSGYGALRRIGDEKIKNVKLAYRIGRVLESATSEIKILAKTHEQLQETYWTKTDDGYIAPADPVKKKDYETAWDDLLTQETDVWGDPIKLDDLDGEFNVSPTEMAVLLWLFTE